MAAVNPSRTRLSELYGYVGDDILRELPMLKTGARTWVEAVEHFPSLQAVQTQDDLANWIDQNPNSGLSFNDFSNYEKLLTYQRNFPHGIESENLQQRIQTEIRSDEAEREASRQDHASHPVHHSIFQDLANRIAPKGVDQDRAFRRILENVIADHNRINPNSQITGNLIVKNGRDRIVNPNIPPALLERAREIFGTAYSQTTLDTYDNLEKTRIYKNQDSDPVIQKMKSLAAKDAQAEVNALMQSRGPGGVVTEQEKFQIAQKHLETHTAQLVKDYPEKAAEYARKNPLMRQQLTQSVKTQKALNKINNKIYRFRPERDPAVRDLRAGKITPEEFVKKYPRKARAYRRRIKEIGDARETLLIQQKQDRLTAKSEREEQKKLFKHKDPSTDPKLQEIKNRYPNRATDPLQKQAFEKDMNEFVHTNKRANSFEYRQDQDVQRAWNRIEDARSKGKKPSRFSRLLRRTHAPAGLTHLSQATRSSRFQRIRKWLRERWEKFKDQIKQYARQYLSRAIRKQALSFLRSAGRLSRIGGQRALGAGVRGLSSAPSRLSSFFKPGMSVPRFGGGMPFRPPVPPAGAGLFLNPWFWVVLFILIIIFLIILWFMNRDDGDVTVTVRKSGPEKVENPTEQTPTEFFYTITVYYTGNPSSITVTDLLPEGVEYVRAEGPGTPTYNEDKHTVSWNIPVSGGGGGTGDVPSGGTEAPNEDTCNGTYNLSQNPIGKNFGDPSCNFTKDALYTLLKQKDPEDADYWFNTVIPCESPGYDPNLYYRSGAAGTTPDAGGAWGLYQMGSSLNGAGTPGNGKNGQYDRGDVPWQQQTTNATTYNNEVLNGGWGYWACAEDRW